MLLRLPGDEITPQKPRDDVKHVIFVIHGIRDVGYWTNKIARRVQDIARTAAPPKVYAPETSNYGYFAMFPFLLPARRREKVEWGRAISLLADFEIVVRRGRNPPLATRLLVCQV